MNFDPETGPALSTQRRAYRMTNVAATANVAAQQIIFEVIKSTRKLDKHGARKREAILASPIQFLLWSLSPCFWKRLENFIRKNDVWLGGLKPGFKNFCVVLSTFFRRFINGWYCMSFLLFVAGASWKMNLWIQLRGDLGFIWRMFYSVLIMVLWCFEWRVCNVVKMSEFKLQTHWFWYTLIIMCDK